MKTILILIILIAALSFSVNAGCCTATDSSVIVYWDFGNWSSQTIFCDNLETYFSLETSWYDEKCNTLNNSILPAGSINGWISPTPITPPTTSSGGGGGRTSRTRIITCEEVAYLCDDWSACVNDLESRDCTKREICNNIPTSRVIKETRSCVPSDVETIAVETTAQPETTTEETTAEEGVPITGAVIGAIGKAPVAYAISFIVIIGALVIGMKVYSKKKKKK